MRIIGVNKQVACQPLPELTIAPEVSHGFAKIKNRVSLVSTKVVFGNEKEGVVPPMRVYLRGDCVSLPWAKTSYEIEGETVILVPVDAIVLIGTPSSEAMTWATLPPEES